MTGSVKEMILLIAGIVKMMNISFVTDEYHVLITGILSILEKEKIMFGNLNREEIEQVLHISWSDGLAAMLRAPHILFQSVMHMTGNIFMHTRTKG